MAEVNWFIGLCTEQNRPQVYIKNNRNKLQRVTRKVTKKRENGGKNKTKPYSDIYSFRTRELWVIFKKN